jgi:protein-L-isoaspartate(D-aspartate) O-methyltransferase
MLRALAFALLLFGACSQKSAPVRAGPEDAAPREQERLQMVRRQIEARGIRDPQVLRAMRTVPRHLFVPEPQRAAAYEDRPLPIGHQQTISQPYIVALMSELADLKPGDKVLEVGTGSGYQAAVLSEMGMKVFSIEIVEPLARQAQATLDGLGYEVKVRHGDGYAGWPDEAPFDAVIVTAAPPSIPKPLEAQVALGGRLVIPVGKHFQSLVRVTRTEKGLRKQKVLPVRFVPMTGEAQQR